MVCSKRARGVLPALIAAISLFVIQPVVAETPADGTYGAAFLRIPIGAKMMALPEIVAGMEPDASFLFANPAVVADVRRTELFLSTATWLEDFNLSASSLVTPLGQSDIRLSFGSRLLYTGGLTGYNGAGQAVGEESFYDVTLTAGVSKRFESVGLSVGLDGTYVREHQPLQDGDGFVADLGASYQFGANRIDFIGRNLGGSLSFDGTDYPIDDAYILGYGRMFRHNSGLLNLGAQVVVTESDNQRLEFGASYLLNSFLTLRGGVDHIIEGPASSSLPYTAGLGFEYGSLSLDYAFTPQEYFPGSHTFSVVWEFGGPGLTRTARNEPSSPTNPPAAGSATPTQHAAPSNPGQPNYEPVKLSYAVIAGFHTRQESAQAEVRALRLLKIPAVVESTEGGYRVLISRYDTRKAAESEVARYRNKGHRFKIVVDG